MPSTPFIALRCPIEGSALIRSHNSWRCEVGHSYDIAREGYVHLHPVQNKRSKDPGDSKEMVAARHRFLASGHYAPIADALCKSILTCKQPPLSVLDAGCGEGYYLRQLQHCGFSSSIIGLDISKWAVQQAAKQDKSSTWVVGSNANLPVVSSTLDCVLSLFGFPVYSEFSRVLKPGGLLVQVDTGEQHLRELRELIYPSVKPAREGPASPPEGFSILGVQSIEFKLALDSPQAIADLLAMTPHFYRVSQAGRERVAALQKISLSVDVVIRILQCTAV